MKKHWKLWTVLLVILIVIVATACRNRQIISRLEAEHGVDYVYYEMGDIVPFEDDYQTYGAENLDGYFLRMDDAQVMTYEEFLDWSGETEDEVDALLKGKADPPEKLCLLTITFFNEDSEADGFYLDEFALNSDTYDLYYDTTLTVLANTFLSWEDSNYLPEVLAGMQSIYLNPGEQATVYLVYDYVRFYFTAHHWNRLDRDSLWFMVTWFPTEKLIAVTLH